MKKALLMLLLAVSSLATFAQCIPAPTGLTPGVYPDNDQIPCIVQNQPFSGAITFQNWDSTTVSGVQVRIDYIIIDSILNLPCGISWSTNFINNRLDNQQAGCIFFNGTTTDPVGEYKLKVKLKAKLSLLPNEVPYELESITGIPLHFRVKANAGAICPPVDTTAQATLQTSSCNIGYLSSYFNTIRGKVYVDTDNNGVFNGNDYGLAGYRVNASGTNYAHTNQNGEYLLYLPTGAYTVSPATNSNYALGSGQSQYTFNFTAGGVDYPGNDFGITVANQVNDLAVTVNNSFFRLGFPASYVVSVTNLGTVIATNANVNLNFDTLFTVNGTSPTAINQTAGKANWAVTNLIPGQTQNFTLNITTPVITTLLGTFVDATAYLDSLAGDIDSANDTFVNIAEFSGAYDPNDKTAYPDVLSEEFVDGNKYITYRIRFQNTGNDTAFNVTVRDTINSPHLNVNSIQLLSASNEYTFRIEQGNIAIWEFNNILLPDSNVNEPGSHGYIFFRIKIKNNALNDGSEILNQAGIYFDFNPVVMTDPSVAKVDFGSSIRNVWFNNSQITVYPNPTSSTLTIEHRNWSTGSTLQLVDLTGKLMLSLPILGQQTPVNIANLPNGIYLYRVTGANGIEGMGKVVVAN